MKNIVQDVQSIKTRLIYDINVIGEVLIKGNIISIPETNGISVNNLVGRPIRLEFVVGSEPPPLPGEPALPDPIIPDPSAPEPEPLPPIYIFSTILECTPTSITIDTLDEYKRGDWNIFIEKDLVLEAKLNSITALVNTTNNNILTNFDFPTYNSCFTNYTDFTDVLIQNKDCYQDVNAINSYIKEINDFLYIESIEIVDSDGVDNYHNELIKSIGIMNKIQAEVMVYFKRLRKLLMLMKISDTKTDLEEWLDMYNAKTSQEQNKIDSMYSVFDLYGKKPYMVNKQTLLFEAKIIV